MTDYLDKPRRLTIIEPPPYAATNVDRPPRAIGWWDTPGADEVREALERARQEVAHGS